MASFRISCPICREDDLKLNDCSEVASCHHRFCTACIEEWATRCSACPLCKQEMTALVTAQSTRKGAKRKVEHRHLEVADSEAVAHATLAGLAMPIPPFQGTTLPAQCMKPLTGPLFSSKWAGYDIFLLSKG
eukprot:s785_g11.t1